MKPPAAAAAADVGNRLRAPAFAAFLALALAGAAVLNTRLHALRAGPDRGAHADAPWSVRLTTVMLGGFRGLLADLLWLRVSYLQDEGRCFELVQLSEWIARLEPQSSEVWSFHAWNLAYNVSVMTPVPQERWRWVRHGLHLLRDVGLACAPEDPERYWELGWLFQHKLGADSDPAHGYYKDRWAAEMAALFDGPRPDYGRLEAHPGRLRRLRDVYKLDPVFMQRVERRYGPVDWRRPEAHALYWAARALELPRGRGSLNAERMVLQSLAAAFRKGAYRPVEQDAAAEAQPDPALLEPLMAAYREALRRHPGNETLRGAFERSLRDAVARLHRAGFETEAQTAYAQLATALAPGAAMPEYTAIVQGAQP